MAGNQHRQHTQQYRTRLVVSTVDPKASHLQIFFATLPLRGEGGEGVGGVDEGGKDTYSMRIVTLNNHKRCLWQPKVHLLKVFAVVVWPLSTRLSACLPGRR
jgi:hypothetical protein